MHLTLIFICAFLQIVIAFSCIRKEKWFVNKRSCREGKHMFVPFLFWIDSFTWVVDVNVANFVPVVMFKKPLLNMTLADLLNETSHLNK
jgi:hypothetical protein